jgi:hypothetical protein
VGHQSPIIQWFSHKARVGVKNGQLIAIKVALRLFRHHVHALMFEVGSNFLSHTTTKPITKEAPIYLEHRCPAIRFNYPFCPKVGKYIILKIRNIAHGLKTKSAQYVR